MGGRFHLSFFYLLLAGSLPVLVLPVTHGVAADRLSSGPSLTDRSVAARQHATVTVRSEHSACDLLRMSIRFAVVERGDAT
jgi:hypothetical protein